MNTRLARVPRHTVQGASLKGNAPAPLVPGRADEHEQLTLLGPYDDGLTFGEWFEALPLDPASKKKAQSLGSAAMTPLPGIRGEE